MKISRIEIGAFGKFEDYTLDLEDGFQVLCGENEDGKTTLMTFISMMFYSTQESARTDITRNPRQKYQPWSEKPMEGALHFTWQEEEYYLSKRFGTTPSRDTTTLTKVATSQPVELGQGEEIGEYFFGLNLSGFQRSSFIGQIGSIDAGRGTDDISEKLLHNLMDSGDQEISQQEVFDRLEKAKYDLVGRSKTIGKLVVATKELEELKEEKQQVKLLLESGQKAREAYEQTEKSYQRKQQLLAATEGYQARREMEHLTSLLKQLEEKESLAQELFSQNMAPENVSTLLAEGMTLDTQYQRLADNIQVLEDSLGDSSAEITQEERQAFGQVHRQAEALESAYRQWSTSFVPANQRRFALEQELAEAEETLATARKTLEALEGKKRESEDLEEEKKRLQQEMFQLREKILEQETLWQRQRQSQQQELQAAEQRLSDARVGQKKTPNALFLWGGIITAVLFVLLAVAVKPILGVGLALSAILLVLAFVLGGPSKEETAREQELSAYVSELSGKLSQWEETVEQEKSQHTAQRNMIDQRYQALPESTAFDRTVFQYQEAAGKTAAYVSEVQRLQTTLESRTEHLQEQSVSFYSLAPLAEQSLAVSQQELAEQTQQFADSLETIKAKRDALLKEKNVNTAEDYQTQYLAYQSHRETVERIEEQKKELATLESRFTALVSQYSLVEEYAKGKEKLEDLQKLYSSYQKLSEQSESQAKTLEISPATVAVTQRAIEKRKEIAQQYTGENMEELERELAGHQSQDYVARLQELQKEIQTPERSLEDLSSEINEKELEVAEMTEYYQGVTLALEIMEQAQEEMRKNFGPLLNEKTSEIFSRITGERYETLTIDKEYQINVKNGLHYKEWGYLSHGTIDQAYFSLRLAIAQLIAPENGALPILLDDVLVQYDDARASRAMKFLKEYAEEQGAQVLLLSCHNRMRDFAEGLAVPALPLLRG